MKIGSRKYKNMLEIKDIQKDYDQKPLLRSVSFQVSPHEIVCLLGSSGSGKSTLLRIIAGLEQQKSGSVYWDGEEISHITPDQRRFGLMFQNYALFPHLNVFDNIAFGLRMQNKDRQKIGLRVNHILDLVHMGDFKNRSVAALSGGEQQRVALARAVAPQPRLLMLDEPLGALDRALRDQLIAEIRDLQQTLEIPVIYVTHDQEEAFAIADRLMILHDGCIIQSGTPEQVYHYPANLWAASFLGFNNIFDAEVIDEKNGTVQTQYGTIALNDPDGQLQLGDHLEIILKPDPIEISESRDHNTGFQGVVQDCQFNGHGYRVSMILGKKERVTIHTGRRFSRNTAVTLSINPTDVLWYKT